MIRFSRTSRQSADLTRLPTDNLAYAELRLVLAALYKPDGPEMELFESDESYVIQAHDFLIPLPKLNTKGVRVVVHLKKLITSRHC